MLALKAIWDGQTLADVCRQQKIRRHTLTLGSIVICTGGYDNLLKRATVERKQLLTLQKQRIVRYIILHKMPVGHGIDSYQWTAEHVRTVIEQKWQIKISCARLYQLFDKWGLSLQRAHRDYGPVNRQEQAQFHR